MTYCIAIEAIAGEVKPYGYHLGTDRRVAEGIIYDKLRAGAISVALYEGSPLPGFGGTLLRIYDFRDLPEYDPYHDEEDENA